MIEHEMAPLETSLMEINAILADYIDHANMGMVGRLRYAVINRSKLHGICSNLTKTRINFGLMLDLVNMKVPGQHTRDGRELGKKSDAILDKQDREAGARKVEGKAQERSDAKLEQILDILQQYFPEAVDTRPMTEEDEGAQTNEILERLEKELVRAGLSRTKACAARKSAAEGLATHELAAKSHSPSSRFARTVLPHVIPSPVAHESPMAATQSSGERPHQPDQPPAKSGPTVGMNPDSSTVLQSSLRPLRTAHELPCGVAREDSLGKPARKPKASETSQKADKTSLQGAESSYSSRLGSIEKTKDYGILIVDSVHGGMSDLEADQMSLLLTQLSSRHYCSSLSGTHASLDG